mmetsp:Transcript_79489/g.222937  ORF Transcript_79489/g.222937 Transcript_79489/m.222937 type:complete len:220 (-) Transcript_79489:217-876(-)
MGGGGQQLPAVLQQPLLRALLVGRGHVPGPVLPAEVAREPAVLEDPANRGPLCGAGRLEGLQGSGGGGLPPVQEVGRACRVLAHRHEGCHHGTDHFDAVYHRVGCPEACGLRPARRRRLHYVRDAEGRRLPDLELPLRHGRHHQLWRVREALPRRPALRRLDLGPLQGPVETHRRLLPEAALGWGGALAACQPRRDVRPRLPPRRQIDHARLAGGPPTC